MSFEPLDRSS